MNYLKISIYNSKIFIYNLEFLYISEKIFMDQIDKNLKETIHKYQKKLKNQTLITRFIHEVRR